MKAMILVHICIVCQLIITAFGTIIYRKFAAILDTLVATYPKFFFYKLVGFILIFMMIVNILYRVIVFIVLN